MVAAQPEKPRPPPADSAFVPVDASRSHFLKIFIETGHLHTPSGPQGYAEASDFVHRIRLFKRVPKAIAELWLTKNLRVPREDRNLNNRNSRLRGKITLMFERGGGSREELEGVVMAQLGSGTWKWSSSESGIENGSPEEIDLTNDDAQSLVSVGSYAATTNAGLKDRRREVKEREMAVERREERLKCREVALKERENRLEWAQRDLERLTEIRHSEHQGPCIAHVKGRRGPIERVTYGHHSVTTVPTLPLLGSPNPK